MAMVCVDSVKFINGIDLKTIRFHYEETINRTNVYINEHIREATMTSTIGGKINYELRKEVVRDIKQMFEDGFVDYPSLDYICERYSEWVSLKKKMGAHKGLHFFL